MGFCFDNVRVMDLIQKCVAPDIGCICREAHVGSWCIQNYVGPLSIWDAWHVSYGQDLDFDVRTCRIGSCIGSQKPRMNVGRATRD